VKEQAIQAKILKLLKPYYTVKVVAATKAGVPDILACINGHFVGIEVKTPKTKTNTSELQKYNLRKIEENGGYSLVAWSVEQVEEFINEAISTSA